jgi:hypothetical protein
MRAQPSQMAFYGSQIASADQAREFDPRDRIVLANRGPRRAAPIDKVGRLASQPDPRNGAVRAGGSAVRLGNPVQVFEQV